MIDSTKLKVYLPSIFVFLLYHVSFISFPYWNGYYNFKYTVIFIVACYLCLRFKIFLNKKFSKINLILLSYIFVVLLSSYINKDYITNRDTFLAAIVFSAVIVESFFLFEYFSINNKTDKLISILYYLTLFYVIVTDLLLIIKPDLYIEKGKYYLIGNKFTVSYLHLQLIALLLQKSKLSINKKNKIRRCLILYSILTFYICLTMECSTGLVGLIILILMVAYEKTIELTIKKTKVIFITLMLSSSLLMLFSNILNNKIISYFVVNVLQEDITLTGRTTIYEKVGEILQGKLLLGYGYGSSFEVMMNFMRAPNTQNGLLEVVLENGIISVLLLMMLIFAVFKFTEKSMNNFNSILIIYVYIILSCVEITFDISFLVWLALVLVCGTSKVDTSSKIKKLSS